MPSSNPSGSYHQLKKIVFLLLLFWPHYAAGEILFPQTGIEPAPSAVEAES